MDKKIELFKLQTAAATAVASKDIANGFKFIDHDPFPMVEVRLNGHPLSIKQLCEAAEQMRLQLLEFGVLVQVKNPTTTYFDKDGTLRNPDGSRSIFDDVDE